MGQELGTAKLGGSSSEALMSMQAGGQQVPETLKQDCGQGEQPASMARAAPGQQHQGFGDRKQESCCLAKGENARNSPTARRRQERLCASF